MWDKADGGAAVKAPSTSEATSTGNRWKYKASTTNMMSIGRGGGGGGGGVKVKKGEAEQGAKRRAANVSVGNESRGGSYFYTRRTTSVITAIILVP